MGAEGEPLRSGECNVHRMVTYTSGTLAVQEFRDERGYGGHGCLWDMLAIKMDETVQRVLQHAC